MQEITPSNTQVAPFVYQGVPVRSVIIDGEPWFVVADAAKVLGYRDASNAARLLRPHQQGYSEVSTPSGTQRMLVANEGGVNRLIMRSNASNAETVQDWFTDEVLPAIRKTGTYGTASAMSDEELIHQALTVSARRVAELTEKVAELSPKAAMADDFLTASGGARLVREVAKLMDMKEKDLRRFLLEEKLVFTKHAPCGAVQYDHYAQFAHHFQATEHVVNHTWGSCTHYTLMILPRGIELIEKRRLAAIQNPETVHI
ncbi:phage antirepressor [Nocardia rhizosphaerae]|uniref:Phage antirepressor n=1 Tax=Nocardia rhizosphaerae TaxID=1691571 RepID=A0ABV8L2M9_9NOCA